MFSRPPNYIPGKKIQRSFSEILPTQNFKGTLSKLLLSRKKSPVSVHLGHINSEIRRNNFASTDLSWVMQLNNFIEIFQSTVLSRKSKINQMACIYHFSKNFRQVRFYTLWGTNVHFGDRSNIY